MGHVFIGRRSEVATFGARERLRALNIESRANVEIHTLDRFVSMAQSSLNLRTSRLPACALTHRDLHKGLAPSLVEFIRSDFGQQRLFIGVRKRRRQFDEDRSARANAEGVRTIRIPEPPASSRDRSRSPEHRPGRRAPTCAPTSSAVEPR